MAVVTRPARPADCPRIAEIYNQGIEDRIATFETEPRTATDIETWLAGIDPVWVAEIAGTTEAFARLSPYRSRACYAGIREFSVYVARDRRGAGLGEAVMHHVLEQAATAGVHKIIARIFKQNTASLALCDRLGFRRVGTYEKHGRLDGIWRDCVIVERLIGEA